MFKFMVGKAVMCLIDVVGINHAGKLVPGEISTHLVRGVVITAKEEEDYYTVDFETSFKQMGVSLANNIPVKSMAPINGCLEYAKKVKFDWAWGQ